MNTVRFARLALLGGALLASGVHARTPSPRDERFCTRVGGYAQSEWNIMRSNGSGPEQVKLLQESRNLDPDYELLWKQVNLVFSRQSPYAVAIMEEATEFCMQEVRADHLPLLHDDMSYVPPPPPEAIIDGKRVQ